MRRLARVVLAGPFDAVYEAENGVEAIEQFESNDPTLVVIAADMSIRDGIEATDEITSTDPSANVIVCTHSHDRSTRERAVAAGAAGYVTKPYKQERLLDEIEAVLAA